MNKNVKKFDKRLNDLLTISGVDRAELAHHLGVAVPVVNRWLNGTSAPDVYQFREIVRLFGMPYDWFLEDGGEIPDAEMLAAKLGLSPNTVEALLELAGDCDLNEDVMAAVDDAICAVLGAVSAAYSEVLPLTEKLSRIARDALALNKATVKEDQ